MYKFVDNPAHQFARILKDGDAVVTFFVPPTQEKGDAMSRGLDVVTHIERFRELRLFHYKEALRHTKSINEAEARMVGLDRRFDNDNLAYKRLAARVSLCEEAHSWHMTFVQTLNILFPIGDNVEGDMPS